MKLFQDLSCKTRFALSRLPYFPVKYRLTDDSQESVSFQWSKVMPFFNPERGLLNFDLWGWDVRELRFLNKFLSPEMVFLDVGSYHGIYSVLAGKKVSPTGFVYSFEPTPSHFHRIKHHLWLNQVKNVTVEQLALSNTNGQAEFHIPLSGVLTVGSLKPSLFGRSKLKKITVQTKQLDSYIKEQGIEKIDLIKVDVEGAEMIFLEGASVTINHFKPLLIVEAIDAACQPWGYKASDLLWKVKQEFDCVLYEFDEYGYLREHTIRDTYLPDSNCNFLVVPRTAIHRVVTLIAKD